MLSSNSGKTSENSQLPVLSCELSNVYTNRNSLDSYVRAETPDPGQHQHLTQVIWKCKPLKRKENKDIRP